MKPRHIVLAIAALWTTGAAHAEILSLHAAWQKAMASEPAWRVAQSDADIDREDANKVRSGLLPQIGLSSTNNRNTLSQPGAAVRNYDSSSAALTLRQPLFRMQPFAELQRAEARGELAEFRLGNEAQALAIRVSQAYFDVLQTEDAIRYSSFLEKSMTTHVDAARKAFRGGSGTRIDIDEARARLALAAADRLAAENASANAKKRLSAIIGTRVGELIPLDEDRAKGLRLTPATFAEWLDIARQHSPELAAAGKAVDETSWAVTTARSGHLPTLDLVMSRSRTESDTVSTLNNRYLSNSIGVQLNLPLFSGGYTSADTAQATARHQRAQALRESTERQIETRLLQEFNGVLQGEERLASLTVALEASEEALRSTRHGVAAGTRTSLDVLNAERQLYSTRLDNSRARYDWIMSRMRLRALAGKLDENEIKEISGLLSLAAQHGDATDSVVRVRPVDGPARSEPVVREPIAREPIPRDSTLTRKQANEPVAVEASPPPAADAVPQPAAEAATEVAKTPPAGDAPPASSAPVASSAPEAGAESASVKAERPATKAQAAAPIVSPQGSGKYVVALGTFGNPENVVKMLAMAEKHGLTSFTETTASGLTRVRAGPYATMAEARKVIKDIQKVGLVGVLDKR